METIQEILMHATEEELDVLIGYCDTILAGSKYKAKVAALKEKQERTSYLFLTIQGFAKSFFLCNLEYDEMVVKVASRMDIELNTNDKTDYIEAKIAGRFITDNFTQIPAEQKHKLAQVLKCETVNESKLRYTADELILANMKSTQAMHEIFSWLANATLQSFRENRGEAWESQGRFSRIFRNLLGGSTFRKAMILPIIYISMLRFKYRIKKKSA